MPIGDDRFRWNRYIDSGKPSLITRKTFKTTTVNEEKTDSVLATGLGLDLSSGAEYAPANYALAYA